MEDWYTLAMIRSLTQEDLDVIGKQMVDYASALPQDNVVSVVDVRHPEENQDAAFCSQDLQTAAVFDGMGGRKGGRKASQAALAAVGRMWPFLTETFRATWLANAFFHVSENISLSRQFSGPDYDEQDATVAMASADGNDLYVLSAGDSRVYLLHQGALLKLTDDDTHPSMMDEQWGRSYMKMDHVQTMDELRSDYRLLNLFKDRNKIKRAGSMILHRETPTKHWAPTGSVVLLTSDGIHDNLTHEEIREIAAQCYERTSDVGVVCFELVQAAQRRSKEEGHIRRKLDDITACGFYIESV